MFSFSFSTFFLVFVLLLNGNSSAEVVVRTCEPITVDLCKGLGYNMTGMPNLSGNDVQHEADFNLKTFAPLIQYGCSQQLKLFLCSVYVPMCTEKSSSPIGPCRGLCESVRSRCYPVLKGFGFPWPHFLNCSLFPVENNHEHMCMEGPKEKLDLGDPVDPIVRKIECSPHSTKNGIGECGPTNCANNVMFDDTERRIAEVWITIWGLACIVISLGSLLTLSLGGGRVRAPPLMALSLCYFLIGAGWALRCFTGPVETSCSASDPTGMKSADGLPNLVCAFGFLLLYYFGMAANAWWVCLCIWWFAKSSSSWTTERLSGLTTALHVVAWGFPALQTVAALVRRDVDADALTGTCYIGNNKLSTLWYLVLLPYFLYFCTGAVVLAFGWICLLRKPKLTPLTSASAPLTQGPHRKERDFLGFLTTLYALPIFMVMTSYFVEYSNRTKWQEGYDQPSLWFFLLLRHFMSLFIGLSSFLWIWCRKSAQVWRSALQHLGPRSQPSKNPPVLKYPLTTHHSGRIVTTSLYQSSRHSSSSSRPHSHRKVLRNHHVRSGSETII